MKPISGQGALGSVWCGPTAVWQRLAGYEEVRELRELRTAGQYVLLRQRPGGVRTLFLEKRRGGLPAEPRQMTIWGARCSTQVEFKAAP